MDLSTTYMGLRLRSPIVAGASPLGDDLDVARRLEDRGAGALVMRSVFAEQLCVPRTLRSGARRSSSVGDPLYEGAFVRDPEDYLRHLGRLKEALSIPVFASLNGASPGPWLEFASALCAAGADGIELNLYALATDSRLDGRAVESAALDVVREVKARSSVPVAVRSRPTSRRSPTSPDSSRPRARTRWSCSAARSRRTSTPAARSSSPASRSPASPNWSCASGG